MYKIPLKLEFDDSQGYSTSYLVSSCVYQLYILYNFINTHIFHVFIFIKERNIPWYVSFTI